MQEAIGRPTEPNDGQRAPAPQVEEGFVALAREAAPSESLGQAAERVLAELAWFREEILARFAATSGVQIGKVLAPGTRLFTGQEVEELLREAMANPWTGPREPILVAMAAATKLCERALELGDLEAAARGAEAAARLAEVRQRE